MHLKATPSVYQTSSCTVSHSTAGKIGSKPHHNKGNLISAFKKLPFIQNVRSPGAQNKNTSLTLTKVDLILPAEDWSEKLDSIVKQRQKPQYYKIKATLGQFLEKKFFAEHIKSGRLIAANRIGPQLNRSQEMHRCCQKARRRPLTHFPSAMVGNTAATWIITIEYAANLLQVYSPCIWRGKITSELG